GTGFVLCSLGFIDDHDDAVAIREERILPSLGPAELLDGGADKALVFSQELPHLLAVLRLSSVGFADGTGVEEIPVDLPVEVLAVGDDDEAVVTLPLSENLPSVEDHGEALARALGVPKNTELAVELFAAEELVKA